MQIRLDHIYAVGGRIWALDLGAAVGYAWAAPIPGLEQLAELEGGILPRWQNQGWGSRMLARILADLQGSTFQQVTCGVEQLDSPAARLLLRHHFFVEHVEWVLRRKIEDAPPLVDKSGVKVVTFDRKTAVSEFTQLYNQIFDGYAWNQPFTLLEVDNLLDHPGDILFLAVQGGLVGLAWLHLEPDQTGVIEPFGIVKDWQGQGYGRYLLINAMSQLLKKGARRLQIGAWRDNEPAIQLYQNLGFQYHKSITYLAANLEDS